MKSYKSAQRLFSVQAVFWVFLALTLVGYQSSAVATQQRIANLSVKGDVGVGDNRLILGVIVQGYQTCKLLFRGIGPSLQGFPPGTLLADPTIEIFDSTGMSLGSNNNWKDNQQAEIQATGLAPTNSLESAIILSLAPGSYTAVLGGITGGTGIALAEVYDINPGFPDNDRIRLAQASVRAHAEDGSAQETLGVIFIGDNNRNVVFRGMGPSFGTITDQFIGPLAKTWLTNPLIKLYERGVFEFSNDDWMNTDEWRRTALINAGLAPTNSLEAAMYVSLGPSAFTVTMENNPTPTNGRALIEAYDLSPPPNPPAATPTPTPQQYGVWTLQGTITGYFACCPGTGDLIASTGSLPATRSGTITVNLHASASCTNGLGCSPRSQINVYLYRASDGTLLQWRSAGAPAQGQDASLNFDWTGGAGNFYMRFEGQSFNYPPGDYIYLGRPFPQIGAQILAP